MKKTVIDLTNTPDTEPTPTPPVQVKVEEGTTPAPAPRARSKRTRRPELSDTVSAIPVASFHRLVREIAQDIKSDLRWEADALHALQVDSEAYLIEAFQRANKVRRLCKSKTLGAEHWTQEARRA